MELVIDRQYFIKHFPTAASAPPIVFACTLVAIGEGPNAGKVLIDTEYQKDVIAYVKDLYEDEN